MNESWIKDHSNLPPSAQEVAAMRAAYSHLAEAVERWSGRSEQTAQAVDRLEKAVLVLTTQRAEEIKRACPDPGSCVRLADSMVKLEARLATSEKDIKASEKELNFYAGAVKVLGVIGAALAAGVVKLFFDSGGKHP